MYVSFGLVLSLYIVVSLSLSSCRYVSGVLYHSEKSKMIIFMSLFSNILGAGRNIHSSFNSKHQLKLNFSKSLIPVKTVKLITGKSFSQVS